MNNKLIKRNSRKNRIRSKIIGSNSRPRMVIFRSNKHLFVQVIDDKIGKTLVSCSDKDTSESGKNIKVAESVGKCIAEKCINIKINSVVFDRNGNKYHGRVAAFAKSARSNGLIF